MKKLFVSVLAGVVLSVAAMSYFAHVEIRRVDARVAKVGDLLRSDQALGRFSYLLETIRSMSPRFKRMAPAEMREWLRQRGVLFREAVLELEQHGLTDAERTRVGEIGQESQKLVAFIEKLLPNLYSKDPYQIEEVKTLHEGIQTLLNEVTSEIQNRGQALSSLSNRNFLTEFRVFIAGGGFIVVLFLLLFAVYYRMLLRPLNALHSYASEIETGRPSDSKAGPLGGTYGTIQSVMSRLAANVEGHRRERHKFILDLFSDLATPLRMLRASGEKTVTVRDPHAVGTVKGGIAVLSGSLEDLVDLAQIGNIETRLDEKLVDVAELVVGVARTLNGSEKDRQVISSVPPIPVWMKVDPRRLERALTHIILKVSGTLERSHGRVRVTLSEPDQENFSGVEILVQDAARNPEVRGPGTGPELDVSRHWISDSGILMTLVRRVICAQGGSVTAAGVSGTSAQVRIRLPHDRLVTRGLVNPPTGLEVNLAQISAPLPELSGDAGQLTQ